MLLNVIDRTITLCNIMGTRINVMSVLLPTHFKYQNDNIFIKKARPTAVCGNRVRGLGIDQKVIPLRY